jgi:hypothetical protein
MTGSFPVRTQSRDGWRSNLWRGSSAKLCRNNPETGSNQKAELPQVYSLRGFAPYRLKVPTISGSNRETPMLSEAEIATSVRDWLTQFETALRKPNADLPSTLFHRDCHWRDVLAFTSCARAGWRAARARN